MAELRGRPGVRARLDGDAVIIERGGVAPDDIAALTADLTQPLEFVGVAADHPAMRDLVATLADDAGAAGIVADEDEWWPDGDGRPRRDVYLRGPTVAALTAFFTEHRAAVPPGHRIVVEDIPARADEPGFARSYLVEATARLDGRHIADAVVAVDPYSYRPIVSVTLDAVGAQIFGDLTAAMVGDKLAIVQGDHVVSAPVINSAIRGGRLTITMGGGDATAGERAARSLASAVAPAPCGVSGVSARSHVATK